MLLRPLFLLCFVCCGFGGAAPAALAIDSVFLRGHEVTPEHIVFGQIESTRSNMAIINLGYAHGVRAGINLLAVRQVDDVLLPISGLSVLQAEASYSRVRIEGPFRVQPDDYVFILASRLDLWRGISRFDQLAREHIVRRQNEPGYSTFDISPRLIDEVARDDEYQGKQYQGVKASTMIREATDKAGSRASEIGAFRPLRALSSKDTDEAHKAESELSPTIRAFGYFAELTRSPNLMIEQLATERLQRLPTQGKSIDIDENTAPLYRRSLLTWIDKSIHPAE
ncbi:MAG: hypothetical protein ACK5Q5_17535 [Planctomycetaceae bacterium]